MFRIILSGFASLVAAFVIMLAFEYTNSLIFPFPTNINLGDVEAVRAFTKTMPWNAYILVWLGWVSSSFVAGWLSITLSKTKSIILPLILGVLLTLLGLFNNIMLGTPLWVTIVGLFLFILPALGGYEIAVKD